MERLTDNIAELERKFLEHPGVYNSHEHTVFASGRHGIKIDLDEIPTESDLFNTWMDVQVQFIQETYDPLPEVIIGTANGANRIAEAIAERIDSVVALETQKDSEGTVVLPWVQARELRRLAVDSMLIVDDVGTTGSSVVPLVKYIRNTAIRNWPNLSGNDALSVLYTWQRQPRLRHLTQNRIVHLAMIKNFQPTFSPTECEEDPEGYCANNLPLVPRNE